MRKWTYLALSTSALLALSACEVRRDGVEDEAPVVDEGEAAGEDTDPTPEASESAEPLASIIRDEDVPQEEDASPPPEPAKLTIPFPDGPDITAAGERLLTELLTEDALDQDWPIVLAGHTDSVGNDLANMRASRGRAEAVAAWLVEHGVDDGRIEVIGFGEQNPVAANALPDGTPNEAGRRANRRVEIRVAAPASANSSTDSDQEA